MTTALEPAVFSEGLVLAGGSGVRLKPVTDTRPKPLIELATGIPILEVIAHNAKTLGVETLWVVTRNHEELFAQACRAISERQGITVNLHLLTAPTRSSLETLRHGLPLVATPPAVFLGDDVTITPSLKALADQFRRLRPAILEAVVREDEVASLQRTCSVSIDDAGWIRDIAEKPQMPTSKIRGCGIYLLGPESVDLLRNPAFGSLGGMTDLVAHFARIGRAAYSWLDGANVNVNTADDLRSASQSYQAHLQPDKSGSEGA